MQQGAILPGRFMPFHRGHEHLILSARQRYPHLTVFVCSTEQDTIPGWQRYYWVKNNFPDLDVRHLVGESALSPERLAGYLPENTGVLIESGTKYQSVAEAIGLQHIIIDPERKAFPVASQDICNDPWAHIRFLPEIVRPYYIKRVALVGPESCGKSFLAEKLAAHYKTVFVEEYGRTYCEKFGMALNELDFAHIAGGQLYREDEMAKKANRVMFCDTDLIVTQVWSEIYFGGVCQPWIVWADHARRYDLFLLLAPDIPWKNDGLRKYERQREWMFERLRQELEGRNLPYRIIRGGFEERIDGAVEAVGQLFI